MFEITSNNPQLFVSPVMAYTTKIIYTWILYVNLRFFQYMKDTWNLSKWGFTDLPIIPSHLILRGLFLGRRSFQLSLPGFMQLSHCIPQLLDSLLLFLAAPKLQWILLYMLTYYLYTTKMLFVISMRWYSSSTRHNVSMVTSPVLCRLRTPLPHATQRRAGCPDRRYWSAPGTIQNLRVAAPYRSKEHLLDKKTC